MDTVPWTRPWTLKGGGIMPRNFASKRQYQGVNVVILWDAQIKNDWPTSDWLTYKQAQAIGAQVKAGEKSTRVVYTNKLTVGEGDEERRIGYLKVFSVFNVAQVDGLTDANPIPPPEITPEQRDDESDRVLMSAIRHGTDRTPGSAIMIPNGAMRARVYEDDRATPVDLVLMDLR
ncbi:MAG: DUF1738 domain-containing protein, partial [Rhizobiales bacterium]|nr:DUF1738 domain-containing protein [Hyphomicrobiales bacterium]